MVTFSFYPSSPLVKTMAMDIINNLALSKCIREAIKAELQEHFNMPNKDSANDEKLLTKKEIAKELGVSLVTLTDWMRRGLPHLRLQSRVYFKKSEVFKMMQQTNNKEEKR